MGPRETALDVDAHDERPAADVLVEDACRAAGAAAAGLATAHDDVQPACISLWRLIP